MERPLVGYVLGTLEAEAREAERRLAQHIAPLPHQLFLQTDPRLMRAVHDRAVTEVDQGYFKWVQGVMRPDLSLDAFCRYFLDHAVFYSDARTWIDSMRRYDLVIGMRIHGAVTAIQAEKLGICVAFDSRTKELAETMGYPYLSADRASKDISFQEMLSEVIFNADIFDTMRARNTAMIQEILVSDGMILSPAA
jgi:hypothetical protein